MKPDVTTATSDARLDTTSPSLNETGDGIPPYHLLLRPTLEVLSGAGVMRRRDIIERVIDRVGLTPQQVAVQLASGGSIAFGRVSWALSYLFSSGLIDRPERAKYAINDAGRDHLPTGDFSVATILALIAKRQPESQKHATPGETPALPVAASEATPDELMFSAARQLNEAVRDELLQRLRDGHPTFFETTVVKLLDAMGYTGAGGAAQQVGGSGDGGIDGIIDQDALGLDRVYIQAKRYAETNTVGREAVQAFVGALHGRGATRGVMITTSTFSRNAVQYAENVANTTRVVLIDGARLTSLMLKYRVGVQVRRTYEVLSIDEDFFE